MPRKKVPFPADPPMDTECVRRGLLAGAALGVMNAGVVVLLDWVLRRRGDFGWYSYSPMPRRYADYLPAPHVVSGWAAAAVFAGVLVALNMIVAAGYVIMRRRRTSSD